MMQDDKFLFFLIFIAMGIVFSFLLARPVKRGLLIYFSLLGILVVFNLWRLYFAFQLPDSEMRFRSVVGYVVLTFTEILLLFLTSLFIYLIHWRKKKRSKEKFKN